jgi:hypothetical protein
LKEVAVAALSIVQSGGITQGLRLKDGVVAIPALTSQVRPALVLAERETRELLAAAGRQDVGAGGRFAAGPAGIQLWSGPFDGTNGRHGSAVHLGSVDWSYDTPTKHYVTIYRVMVTQGGLDAGETVLSVMTRVLALSGISADGNRMSLPAPPARDPFRSLATV